MLNNWLRVSLSLCLLLFILLPVALCPILPFYPAVVYAEEVTVQPPQLGDGIALLNRGELDKAIKIFQDIVILSPDDPMPYYYLGLTYFRMGNLDPAIEALEKALKLNPELVRAHMGLGAVYERKGEIGKARREYKAAIDGGERAAVEMLKRLEARERMERDERLRMANTLFSEGKLEEALKELEVILTSNPDDIDALYNAGFIYARLKRYREALGRMKKVVELDPAHITAHLQLGYMYHSLGVYAEAKKEFEFVIGAAPGGDEAAKAGERLKDVDNRIKVAEYFKQSSDYREKKELDSALSASRKILDIEPENALALYDMAITYHMMEKKDEAIDFFKKAIKINPDYTEAYFQLGAIYELLGRNEEAVAEYERAAGKDKEESKKAAERLEALKRLKEAQGRSERIKVFLAVGDIPSALQEAEAYVLEETKNPKAHVALARIYVLLNKMDEAVSRLRVAIDIDPKYWDAYFRIGEVYEAKGKYPEAGEAYRSITSGAPETSEGKEAVQRISRVTAAIHFEKGKGLMQKGDFEGAIREMQQLIEIVPDNPVALFNTGIIYDRLDRTEEAETFLKEALRINPEYVHAHLQLALLYDRTQRFDDARREYETVISIAKEGKETEIAKLKLGLLAEGEVFASRMKTANNLLKAGNYAGAQEEIEGLIVIFPDNYVAYYTLGVILDRMERYEEAIRALRRSVEIKKDYATAHLYLGRVYEKESMFSNAREEFKKAITFGEGTRDGEIATVRLNRLKNWRGSFSVNHNIDTNLAYGVKRIVGVGTGYVLSVSYYLLRGKGNLLSAGGSNSRSISYRSQLWGDSYSTNIRWEITFLDRYKLAMGGNYNYSLFDREPTYQSSGFFGEFAVAPEAIPTSFSMRYNFSTTDSFRNTASNASQHGVSFSIAQRLSLNDTISGSYSFSSYVNEDPIGSNYANRSNSLSVNYSRTLMPGFSASMGYNIGLIAYTNPDSTTLFQAFRRNVNQGINMGLSYTLSEKVSMSLGYNHTEVDTNLRVPTAEERQELADILAAPIPLVGGGYTKNTFNIGVGVSF